MKMEEIYENIKEDKPTSSRSSENLIAPQVSNRGLLGAVVFLGFFCGFLMAGLIVLGVYTPDLLSIEDDLSDLLPTNEQIWNLTNNRDRLNATLTNLIQELETLRTERTCPEGWRLFSGSCYFFSTTVGSWETARQNCRNEDADLLIINTKEEQDFISGFIVRYWIGLSDREQEGTWKWVDGSAVTLSFWHPGEPNNNMNYGGEDCVETWVYSQWNDVNCGWYRPWICEK